MDKHFLNFSNYVPQKKDIQTGLTSGPYVLCPPFPPTSDTPGDQIQSKFKLKWFN